MTAMFTDYLSFGGNEIANSARLFGYSRTADCPTFMIKAPVCTNLEEALGDDPYTVDNIQQAPWYDETNPDVSSRFFGATIVSVKGLLDSSREVPLTEGISDGGILGASRRRAKKVRVKLFLLANGNDALEYGIAWLNAQLSSRACGQHGSRCGTADFEFFVDCPPPMAERPVWTPEGDPEEYEDLLLRNTRYLHDCKTTSGLLLLKEHTKGSTKGAEVEFTVTSERGYLYTPTRAIALPQSSPTAVQDIQYNLFEYPSAEVADSSEVGVATNYVTNPSLETNDNGWSALIGVGERVSGELVASGAYSYKVTSTSQSGIPCIAEYSGTLPSGTSQVSAGVWGAAIGGVSSLEAHIGIGGTSHPLGSTTSEFGGVTFSKTGLPTNGATSFTITVVGPPDLGPGSIYADAAFVTVP